MTERRNIHDWIQEETDFQSLVAEFEDESRFLELFREVEKVGQETKSNLENEPIPEFDDLLIGLMRLLWEAHRKENEEQSEFLAGVQ